MSPLNTNDLHRIFEKLDLNGDGSICLNELKCLFERLDVNTTKDELKALVGKKDLDLVDFIFFYESVIKQNLDKENEKESNDVDGDLAKAFKVYDLDGDGYITCEELQSVLSRLGLWNEHCGKDCLSMINFYDKNSDGVLDFEEFKAMMLVTNP